MILVSMTHWIIHEICHAVTPIGHGASWQRRMAKAADRADELKRPALAKILRDEIVAYRQACLACSPLSIRQLKTPYWIDQVLNFQQIKRWIASD